MHESAVRAGKNGGGVCGGAAKEAEMGPDPGRVRTCSSIPEEAFLLGSNRISKIVLLTSGVPLAIGMTCLMPVLPKIEDALARSSTDTYLVKFVSTSIALGVIAGAPIAGALSDRFGRRFVLIASYLIFALFGMAGFFLDDFETLIASRLIVGAAASAALTAGVALIGDRHQGHQRSRLMGLNAMMSSIFALITMPVAGVLGGMTWQAPFLMHGIGLPLAALALVLKETPRVRTTGDPAKSVGVLATVPMGLVAMAILAGLIIFGPVIFIPFRLRDIGIGNPDQIAILLTIKSLAAAAMAATYGWARQRLSINQVFIVSFALCAAGTLGFCVEQAYSMQLASAVMFGIGIGWVAPNLMSAAISAATEATRGKVVGLVKAGNLVSSFLAVVLFEPVSKLGGPELALAAIALLAATVLILCCICGSRILRSPLAEREHL